MHLDSQYGEKTSKRDACRLSMERKPLGEIHIDTHYGEKFMHDKPVYGILLQ